MIVRFKKLHPDAVAPRFAHDGDACADLVALSSYEISPGDTQVIKTGIAIALHPGFEALVRGRSGNSSRGLLVHLGTVDSGYRGEIGVIATNLSRVPFLVSPGDRIAQLAIRRTELVSFLEASDLPNTSLELFARRIRPGWEQYGNQLGILDIADEAAQ